MKIALIGYGKMGQTIEKVAEARGHTIVARCTSRDWNEKAVADAQICIEFTHPQAVVENIRKIVSLKKLAVIGTTGWEASVEQVRSMVLEQGVAALYSSNFSIGVNVFFAVVEQASKLLDRFEDYGAAGIEYHHAKKKDAPSGTALQLENIIRKNMKRIPDFSFNSVRSGFFPGTHTLLFDSPCDTITLTHEARNREGFASGAVYAAEWLLGKKGVYTFSDCMAELLYKR